MWKNFANWRWGRPSPRRWRSLPCCCWKFQTNPNRQEEAVSVRYWKLCYLRSVNLQTICFCCTFFNNTHQFCITDLVTPEWELLFYSAACFTTIVSLFLTETFLTHQICLVLHWCLWKANRKITWFELTFEVFHSIQ